MKIYLVESSFPYEGGTIAKAFKSRAKAEEFAAKCRAYYDAMPKCPEQNAADSQWTRYDEKYNEWRDNHPAPGHESNPDWHLIEIELEP